MTFGTLQIHPLPEGRFTVGLDKRFVPHAEGAPKPAGTLFVSVCPHLVVTPHETVLLDAGLGSWAEGRGVETLLANLQAHGVAREGVDRVVLSHLHFDHAGGAVVAVGDEWRPTFPNAEYVVQAAELSADGYRGRSADARALVADTLDAAGQLHAVSGDGPITDEISAVVTGGHTGAHQMLTVSADAGAGDLRAVYAADVLAGPTQVTRRYTAKYDTDGAASQAWRDRIVAEAAERGDLLLFYHSTSAPLAFVEAAPKGGWAVVPVEA